MIANYHTHTWRCKHAEGTEREYVEQAIAAGIRTLGFADHTPYPFPNGYVSYFRMEPPEAGDYFSTLTALKQEYADRIDIRIGVEAEYYPDYFDDLLRLLREYPCEYMIMGQHFIYHEPEGEYAGWETEQEASLAQYVSQTLQGLSTGLFSYLAHPDLLHWGGDPACYRREMERLCRGAKALDVPLEINLLGLAEGRHYPVTGFWEIAGAVGNTVVLGCDAHRPWELNRPEVEQQGRALAQRFGLTVSETVPLRPIMKK